MTIKATDRGQIDAEFLRKLIEYDPHTGMLAWKTREPDSSSTKTDIGNIRGWNKNYAGKEALGSASGSKYNSYKQGSVLGYSFRAHRVCWCIYYGEWPKFQIDHIDGDRHNNKISNLRDIPQEENVKNSARPSNNKTGVRGVHWCKKLEKWFARIEVGGEMKYGVISDDFFEVCCSRKSLERQYGFHLNHGRR